MYLSYIYYFVLISLFVILLYSLQDKKTNIQVKINEWSEVNTLLHFNHVCKPQY